MLIAPLCFYMTTVGVSVTLVLITLIGVISVLIVIVIAAFFLKR